MVKDIVSSSGGGNSRQFLFLDFSSYDLVFEDDFGREKLSPVFIFELQATMWFRRLFLEEETLANFNFAFFFDFQAAILFFFKSYSRRGQKLSPIFLYFKIQATIWLFWEGETFVLL